MMIEILKAKNDVEFRLDQIVADPNYDCSKLSLENVLAVRAHAQTIAIDGSLEFHTSGYPTLNGCARLSGHSSCPTTQTRQWDSLLDSVSRPM